jgi:hypothetical protein
MKKRVIKIFFLGSVALLCCLTAYRPVAGQSTPQGATLASAAGERALLDQYCVTCHNDKLKTANFSLQKLDLATAGDHPEVWEKVVRKLRAGLMPPPGIRRPPLADYEGLRDFLETEIDRKATGHANPGSVILHRLNRTEYANAVRDLLDLEVDTTTLLPPDDSAHGFDNIAGSLTISPTLLEAYTTAATRVARMAVGYWRTPTESAYIAPGDTSQNQHIEGLPFGTRGGMLVRHSFPSDGDYKFSIQNFGLGKYVPGEQLEFLIDGERVHLTDYVGIGLTQGMAADNGDGAIEITIPVKAGTHMVGVTFLATNYRPSLDMIRQYERKSLENNSIPRIRAASARSSPASRRSPPKKKNAQRIFSRPSRGGRTGVRRRPRIWSGSGAFTRMAGAGARSRTASSSRFGES